MKKVRRQIYRGSLLLMYLRLKMYKERLAWFSILKFRKHNELIRGQSWVHIEFPLNYIICSDVFFHTISLYTILLLIRTIYKIFLVGNFLGYDPYVVDRWPLNNKARIHIQTKLVQQFLFSIHTTNTILHRNAPFNRRSMTKRGLYYFIMAFASININVWIWIDIITQPKLI